MSEAVARRTFHMELDHIRGDLVRLAAMVCDVIPRATQALLDGDVGAANGIVDADAELDRIARDVEDRCYHQLALQQPMAGDLRAIVTAIRMSAELERSGDLIVNIVKTVRRLLGQTIEQRSRGLIQQMSDEALRLFEVAVQSYAEHDEVKGAALRDMDDTLDEVHHAFIEQVLKACRSGHLDVQVAVQLALIGRYYERIGDHAVNIGEKVCFLVSGTQPVHERAPLRSGDEPTAAPGVPT